MKKGAPSRWSGRRVLITAGPTREPMDPIRFLTNASSGTMGFALARAARDLGAKVTVVSGPCQAADSRDIEVLPVVTADEMHRKVLARYRQADVIIGAAAVGDWKFEKPSVRKIKKTDRPLRLTLVPNPDIIADVSKRLHAKNGRGRRRPVVVGFALETDHAVARAKEKMQRKGLDLVVANGPESMGLGRARMTIVCGSGGIRRLAPMSKPKAARAVLRCVQELF